MLFLFTGGVLWQNSLALEKFLAFDRRDSAVPNYASNLPSLNLQRKLWRTT